MSVEPTLRDRVEVEIDSRLPEIRAELLDGDWLGSEEARVAVASFVRAAYYRGYLDAGRDEGRMLRDLGLEPE